MIEDLPYKFDTRTLYFFEKYESVVTNYLFNLYNKPLEKILRSMLKLWDKCIVSTYFREGHHTYFQYFTNPGYLPLNAD